MPRNKRSKNQPEKIEKMAEQGQETGGQVVRSRSKCPVCGLMATVEMLEESPFTTEFRIQSFGGSISASESGTGKMKPNMEYEYGSEKDELKNALMYLRLIQEAQDMILEVLPDLYADAGEEAPEELNEGIPEEIMEVIPDKAELLAYLLSYDNLWEEERYRRQKGRKWRKDQEAKRKAQAEAEKEARKAEEAEALLLEKRIKERE